MAAFLVTLAFKPWLGLLGFAATTTYMIIQARRPARRALRDYTKAKGVFDLGTFGEALERFRAIESAGFPFQAVLLGTAHCYYHQERWAEAVQYFDRIARRTFLDDICLAEACSGAGNNKRALEIALVLPGDNPLVALLRGILYCRDSQATIAVEVLKQALGNKRKMEEPYVAIRYRLGLAYKAAGQRRDALKHLQKIFAFDSDYGGVAEELASLRETAASKPVED